MELNIKADLTQTLGLRQMHNLMEINIKSDKKFECIFINKKQAQQVIDKLQRWVNEEFKTNKKINISGNPSDFEYDLAKLINDYIKAGLKKPDLVKKMEWMTGNCKFS